MRLRTVVLLVLFTLTGNARADDNNKAVARGYFQAGVAYYDQGKYELALNEFQRAQAMSHNAELYFNMAACEEHMDHYQAAAVFLKQYLLERPAAGDRENVETRIRALEQREDRVHRPDGETVPPPQPVVLPPQAPPPPKPHKPVAGWALLGVTAGLAVATIAVGSYTVAHHSDLKSGCGASVNGCSPSDIDGLKGAANGTDALIGITAAAAVATVVVMILERRHPAVAKSAARVGFAF